MEELRPNGYRAKQAITLIWIVFLLEIVSLISGFIQYDLLQAIANGEEVSEETANYNDTREQIIVIVYLIAYIISAITFIRWFRRAYFNLHLKVKYLSQTEGWAAGSWFVPIMNWFIPYRIMKELYEETKELLINKGLTVKENFTTGLLGYWWTIWIINNLVGQFVFHYAKRAVSIDELITTTVASMLSNIIGIPLALITVKIIQDYADIEPMLHEIKEEEELKSEEELTTA